jgi:transcriptional regulator with XRE-family HTH domain
MSDLGTALALLRIVRGWSQDELAKAAGLRGGTISDYERGKMVPGLATAKKLLAAEGYTWEAVDIAQDFILRLQADRLKSSEAEPNGDDLSALGREIEDVSTLAGSVVCRIVRLVLNLIRHRTSASSSRDSAADAKAEMEAGKAA